MEIFATRNHKKCCNHKKEGKNTLRQNNGLNYNIDYVRLDKFFEIFRHESFPWSPTYGSPVQGVYPAKQIKTKDLCICIGNQNQCTCNCVDGSENKVK